jgi:hypothetical protein
VWEIRHRAVRQLTEDHERLDLCSHERTGAEETGDPALVLEVVVQVTTAHRTGSRIPAHVPLQSRD